MRTYLAGTLVTITTPDGDQTHGIVLDGPITKNGKQIYKIDHGDFENWYPVEWISVDGDK